MRACDPKNGRNPCFELNIFAVHVLVSSIGPLGCKMNSSINLVVVLHLNPIIDICSVENDTTIVLLTSFSLQTTSSSQLVFCQWHIVTGQIDSIDWAFYVIYLRYKNLAIPQLVLGSLFVFIC